MFDHHDLCPELFESRFPDGSAARLLGPSWSRAADLRIGQPRDLDQRVIPRKALERGAKRPEEVTVVRTGPDADRLRAGRPGSVAEAGHGATWWPTSGSWALRTASTSSSGRRT